MSVFYTENQKPGQTRQILPNPTWSEPENPSFCQTRPEHEKLLPEGTLHPKNHHPTYHYWKWNNAHSISTFLKPVETVWKCSYTTSILGTPSSNKITYFSYLTCSCPINFDSENFSFQSFFFFCKSHLFSTLSSIFHFSLIIVIFIFIVVVFLLRMSVIKQILFWLYIMFRSFNVYFFCPFKAPKSLQRLLIPIENSILWRYKIYSK